MSRTPTRRSPQPNALLARQAQRFQELKRGLDQLEYFCNLNYAQCLMLAVGG